MLFCIAWHSKQKEGNAKMKIGWRGMTGLMAIGMVALLATAGCSDHTAVESELALPGILGLI